MQLSGFRNRRARSPMSRREARMHEFKELARRHGRSWGANRVPWLMPSRFVELPAKRGGTMGVPMARNWFTSWSPSWWTGRATNTTPAHTLGGLGLVAPENATISAPAEPGSKGTLLDTISSIFTAAVPAYTQYQLAKTNADLVKAGKAPLDTKYTAPSVRVIAEPGQAAQSLTKIALIGAGALGGLFIVSKMLKKR